MRLFFPLSGDDVFISYSRKDGSLYAAGLADKLTEKNLSCFIDRLGSEPGHELPNSLKKRIKACSIFVLVASENAAQSESVHMEIVTFKQTGRTILPIELGSSAATAVWSEEIPGLAWENEKNMEALDTGNPSENVVNFVTKSFNYTRRNQYMNRMFYGALTLFLLLLGLSAVSYNYAQNQLAFANEQTRKADEQARRAEEFEILAEEKAREAESASARADSEKIRADLQTRIADEKAKESVRATRLAKEQTQKAKLADGQRIDAENRKNDIERIAALQEQKARNSLAENYLRMSETEARTNPLKALPWIQKAIDTVSESSDLFQVLKMRALHSARGLPHELLNTRFVMRFSGEAQALFSDDLDKVFIYSGSGEAVWDIKKGILLPHPSDRAARPNPNNYSPVFSPDGKWIGTYSMMPDSNKFPRDSVCLYFWEAENPENYWKECDSRFSIKHMSDVSGPAFYFSVNSGSVIVTFPGKNAEKREFFVLDLKIRKKLRFSSSDILREDPVIKLDPYATGKYDYNADQKNLENYSHIHRNPVSRNSHRNHIVTFENEVDATKVKIEDIVSGEKIGKPLQLEKYIDFIDFTNGAQNILTISHTAIGGRIFRVWDIDAGIELNKIEDFPYRIIASSKTGNKMLLKDIGSDKYYFYDIKSARLNEMFYFYKDFNPKALFSEDEKTLVTWSIAPGSSGRWDVNIFGLDGYGAPYLKKSTIKVEDEFRISGSAQKLGYLSKDGIVFVQNIVTEKSVSTFRTPLPHGTTYFEDTHLSNDLNLSITSAKINVDLNDLDYKYECWDLTTNKLKWTRVYNGKPAIIGWETSFSRDDRKFMIASFDAFRGYRIQVLDTDNGDIISEINNVGNSSYVVAAFDATGTKVLVVGNSGNPEGTLKFRQWDAATGVEDESTSFAIGSDDIKKLDPNSPIKQGFSRFSRFGEFMIFRDPRWRFSIRRPVKDKMDYREYKFSISADFDLAISILTQAKGLGFDEKNNLVANISENLSVELVQTKNGTMMINKQTGQQILGPRCTSGDLRMKLSPDGLLVASRKESGVCISSTRNRMSVIEGLGYNSIDVDFLPDMRAITVSGGRIDTWFVGKPEKGKSKWLQNMSSALSGMEITDRLDIVDIPQERLAEIRKQYLIELQKAAARGNIEARYILSNLEY